MSGLRRADFPLPDRRWQPLAPFWNAASHHQLVFPRCDGCERIVWYPAERCRRCGHAGYTWTPVSGGGRLFSWTVVEHAFLPQFADLVPFAPGLVAIDEDPSVRLATRIVSAPFDTLCCDMPVRVVFEELRFTGVGGSVVAPCFTPV